MNNKFIMSNSDTNTDSESYYETDDENITDSNYNFYDPEEPSQTKYNIVLCEKYNPQYHGITDGEVIHHYLTHIRFKKYNYNEIRNTLTTTFRRSTVEIAECIYLMSQECISILKTFWLKIIQRKWKNILKERKIIIKKRSHPNSLRHREIYGKWPNDCCNYPVLKGMLSKLSSLSRTSPF
jgi:hypothetical protein